MPRVVVTTDGPRAARRVLVDEIVTSDYINAEAAAVPLLDRLERAVTDAEHMEKATQDAYAQRVGA